MSQSHFVFVFAFVVVLASTAQLARIGLGCVLASTAGTNRSSLQFASRALAQSRDLRFDLSDTRTVRKVSNTKYKILLITQVACATSC